MEVMEYFQYNSVLILTFFFLSFGALILKYITLGSSNKLLFSSYRSSLLNPLTYVRLFTHALGHADWKHFSNNFLYILLIGPMIEEKYGFACNDVNYCRCYRNNKSYSWEKKNIRCKWNCFHVNNDEFICKYTDWKDSNNINFDFYFLHCKRNNRWCLEKR